MGSGKYRHWITIEENTGTAAGSSTHYRVQESWVPYMRVWAAIDTGGSRQFWAAKQLQQELTHLVQTPYRSDLDASKELRIKWGGQTLYLLGPPINLRNESKEWEFKCLEDV